MWRSEVKGRFYEPFFDTLKEVYTWDGPPSFGFKTPLFDSWDLQDNVKRNYFKEWEILPSTFNVESEFEGSELTGSTVTAAQRTVAEAQVRSPSDPLSKFHFI
jgi:hypothetical protein